MFNTRVSLITLFISISCLSLHAQSGTNSKKITSGGKLKPVQANMDIRHYTLSLDVDIEQQTINGFTEIALELKQAADTILLDLISAYQVEEVALDNKKTSFTHTDDAVIIAGTGTIAGGRHTIKIKYRGKPPVAVHPPWDGGFTWTKDKAGNPWVAINCQGEGGKIYFPCKDHPSDEPDEGVDLYISVPRELSVAALGVLQSVKKNGRSKSIWHWKTNYTISNYCILFNIAKYELVERKYTTIDGNTVPMQYYVLPEGKARAAAVLDIRARDTRILEKYFGEYPWVKEKIGIAQVPNPGMEHQTMITYGDTFAFAKYPNFEYSDNLFHEFSHEWFANKVTNTDWAHMWIQEGIATYADALFFREMLGEYGYDSIMVTKRSQIDNLAPVVPGEGITMEEVYNGDVYTKGAFLMHTLRYTLGDSAFFPALKRLSMDVAYPYNRFLSTDDVEKHFSTHANRDLKPLFDFYLRKTETLNINVIKIEPETYLIYVKNFPMDLPMDITTDSGTKNYMLKNITRETQPITIKSKTQPVIDAGGWYFKKVIYQ